MRGIVNLLLAFTTSGISRKALFFVTSIQSERQTSFLVSSSFEIQTVDKPARAAICATTGFRSRCLFETWNATMPPGARWRL